MTVGAGVRFGVNVVIHPGVILYDGVTVEDGAVLGKAPVLAAHSSSARVSRRPLVVGAGSTICAQAVIFAGASIGRDVIVGDQAHIREGAVIGDGTVIGRASAVSADAEIGERVRVQTGVWLTSWTVVEDDVFLGPGVMTMNDDTMSRHPRGERLRAPILRRACRIGAAVRLAPGVEVGEEAFVAAGAVVARDVPARARVMGVPARVVGQVGDHELLERWR